MGSEQGDADEQPVHTVALDAFWLDQTEVTNAQYEKCVTASVCDPSTHVDNNDYNAPDQPVLGVDWESAIIYCGWVDGRLPTEAEWEYAARGPESLTYPWGNVWQAGLANCKESQCQDNYADTAPVGRFPVGASWVGALDMAGNVWEWTADWYDAGYYARSPHDNPTGPEDGQYRVLRGGSWASFAGRLRSSYRHRLSVSSWNFNRGFRCVQDPSSTP
jgi:formylglycine-generating enzyme required for sulfatase activity